MGAVHGCHLKYVGLSALSVAGYAALTSEQFLLEDTALILARGLRSAGTTASAAAVTAAGSEGGGAGLLSATAALLHLSTRTMLGYSAVLNGGIAVLFKLRKGMGLIGKDPRTGQIPLWSYLVYAPFHVPTYVYTHLHTLAGKYKPAKKRVPVASEVQPGWWVGGCYSHELNRDWGGIVDLTVEFPESCFDRSESYLCIPTWDGVPASPAQLEEAATYAAKARERGDVLIHCAHGRGRSTTVMCAALVKAGLYPTWQEAFEKGIKPGRPVCKLNSKMRQALTDWQADYVDGRKMK